MQKTNIQYLTHSWNPIAMRCTPCSPGCLNCWHLKKADMLSKNPSIDNTPPDSLQDAYAGIVGPTLVVSRLKIPGGKPKRIGVQFMGDIAHDDVHRYDFLRILTTIRQYSQHIFLVLTKRPNNLKKNCAWYNVREVSLPDNLWVGVSVCTQKEADEKIPILLQIPAKVRFVSVEPILERIRLIDLFDGSLIPYPPDWVIAGCESGPGRRFAHISWFRGLKDQCVAAGVPFFLKQAEWVGKIRPMPMLDGKVWDQLPEA